MTDADRDAFIQRMLQPVLAARDQWGILPSIALAQACLESAYGTRLSAQHNYVGLKDVSFDAGSGGDILTVEDPAMADAPRRARFENFRNETHCAMTLGRLLMRVPAYAQYRDALPDPEACALALQGVYAMDMNYADKLMQIVDRHDLRRYDDAK